MVLQTVQGSDLYIIVQEDETYVNSAKVLQVDFLIANGVLHTIGRYKLCPHTL